MFVVQCSCAMEVYTPVSRDKCVDEGGKGFFLECGSILD